MICKSCEGMRFVSVKRPQYQTKNIHYTKDGYPAWPNIGAYVVKESFPTGRMVGYLEPCEDCQATGLALNPAHDPDCGMCHGRGEMTVSDGTGCVDYDICPCKSETKPANPIEAELLGRLENAS